MKNKVLLVDDDPFITESLAAKLEATFKIVACNDPKAAVELARNQLPDIIISDVAMPGMDGYEFCRQIKSHPETSRIPVVFLTAMHNESHDENRGFQMGAVDYLSKTVHRSVLETRLHRHIESSKMQAQLEDQNSRLESRVAERTAELEANREALREAMRNLRTTRVTTGVYWVQIPEAGLYVLCGSPGDVVKHLMLRGYISEEKSETLTFENGPNAILLSDVLLQNGSFSNLSEFPVLQMLYRQGMLLPRHPNNTGRKPILIGSEDQVRAQLQYIRRGNYGLVDENELRAGGLIGDEARRHMAIKLAFAFGTIRRSEDLIDSRILGDQPAEIFGGVTIRRLALNRFEFAYRGRTTEVDLNLPPGTEYEAPYTMGQHPIAPEYFGVIHCGEGDGWDVRRQAMGSIVMFQGRYYLVDAGANILFTLNSLGINLSEVEGIFHTHAHDDHFAGLPTLLASGRRIKYFATPLVRESVTKKLSALISIDASLFAELFEVHELVSGQWNDCDGMEVMPIYSPHPVETTSFVFRAHDDDGQKTYAHLSDIVSMSVLQKLAASTSAANLIDAAFIAKVHETYTVPATLKKIDAGSGMIHGNPADFDGDTSDKIVLAHRANPFTNEELDVGSQSTFGAVDVLIASRLDYVVQAAQIQLSRLFPGVRIEELNALLRSPFIKVNAGSLILRRGTRNEHVYLLVSGSVIRSSRSGEPTLTLSTGELIGVENLYQDDALPYSWRAASPVRLLRIAIKAFRTFLLNGGWHQTLRSELVDSAFLRSTRMFGERLELHQQAEIARSSTVRTVNAAEHLKAPPGATLSVVVDGGVDLVGSSGFVIERVAAGGILAEETCLDRHVSAWQAIASSDSTLMDIPWDAIRRIPVLHWKVLEAHERRLRVAALAAGKR